MLKKILLSVFALIILVLVIGYFSLNFWLKHGIETFAPKVLGVPVTVSSVSINPWGGELTINDLEVGNPKPFKGKYLANIKQIHVKVDMSSISTPEILVNKIMVTSPHLIYETGFGGSNLGLLQANIAKHKKPTKQTKSAPTETKSSKTVVIKLLKIDNTKVTSGAFGAKLHLLIPNMQLEDLGKPGKGMSVTQISTLVMKMLFKNLGQLGLSVVSGAVDTVGNVAKGAANTAIDTAGKVGSAAGNAVKSVGSAIGSIFGGSSKEK